MSKATALFLGGVFVGSFLTGVPYLGYHRSAPARSALPTTTTSTTRAEVPGVTCWIEGHKVVTSRAAAAQLRCLP